MAEMSETQVKEYFEKQGAVELPPEVVKTEESAEVERKTEEKAAPADKKEAPKEGEKDGEDKRGGGDLRVALHEERQERKALRERLEKQEREHAAWRTEADKKLQTFIDQVAKGKEPPPPGEDDPVAYFKHVNKQLEDRLKTIEAERSRSEEASKTTEQLNNFVTAVRNHENDFKKEAADYDAAAQHLLSFWRTEAEMAGIPTGDVQKAVFIRSSQFANTAMQRGENPAKSAYELAKKLGYKAGEKKAEDKKTEVKDESLDTLKRIEKGQESAKGISGTARDEEITIASLSQKSDDEIAELVSDPKFWKKLEKKYA